MLPYYSLERLKIELKGLLEEVYCFEMPKEEVERVIEDILDENLDDNLDKYSVLGWVDCMSEHYQFSHIKSIREEIEDFLIEELEEYAYDFINKKEIK